MTTETKVKHTPGPWRVGGIIPEGAIQIHCEGPPIGLTRFSAARSQDEALANARLIAAAPEQHEELADLATDLQSFVDCGTIPDAEWITDNLESIRTVLAKAEP